MDLMAMALALKAQKMNDSKCDQLLIGMNSIAAAMWMDKNPPEAQLKDVNFYDYDGKVVYSYTKAEFLALEEMPASPAHEGLISQGWNWTFSAAQAYVTAYGSCEIGQSYITSDGKTRAVIEIGDTERLTVYLQFTQTVAQGVAIDWGDESEETTAPGTGGVTVSHTYPAAGKYTIQMTVAEGCVMQIGKNAEFLGSFIRQGAGLRVNGRSVLTELYIGSGVSGIALFGLAFQSVLHTLVVPVGVTSIGNRGLDACIALKALILPAGMTSIGNYVFRCNYQLLTLSLPEGLATLGPSCMTCVSLRRVSIPEGVATIGVNTFSRCFSATVIVVPDSVSSFGDSAFANCYSLLALRVPSGVTAIPKGFARQCHNLAVCELPDGITSIGEMAFSGVFAFASMVIPSTVTSIGRFAFLYTDGAQAFHVLPVTPPIIEPTAFTSTAEDLIIYVPYSADHSVLNAYLAATNWSGLGDKMREEDAP